MKDKILELLTYRDFFSGLVFQQLHVRYQGSALGFLWTLLHPLVLFASFSVIFSYLNRWDLKDFGVYFFSGFIAWNFVANTCGAAAESILNNSVFVTRIYAPKALFPLVSVAVNLVDVVACLTILVSLMLGFGTPLTAAMGVLPFAILVTSVFVAGLALLCAQCNVFFRDFRYVLNSVLFIGFFFSPILFKIDAYPPGLRDWVGYSPMVPFLSLFQLPIWKGEFPPLISWLQCVILALLAAVAGTVSFFRTERKLYFYL